MNTQNTISQRDEWEGEVYDEVEILFDCCRSDAQGIVECQPFIMAQSWGLGLSPKEVAQRIFQS